MREIDILIVSITDIKKLNFSVNEKPGTGIPASKVVDKKAKINI